jgi:hypothetical protein
MGFIAGFIAAHIRSNKNVSRKAKRLLDAGVLL